LKQTGKKRGVRLNKKSQVTIFIIIGMIILVTVGLFIYFKIATTKRLGMIYPEAIPVNNFVESCINNVAKEGITKAVSDHYLVWVEIMPIDR